eukprot:SAG31_NODE_457_length_15415_cov_4.380387_14_plen_180_part_00
MAGSTILLNGTIPLLATGVGFFVIPFVFPVAGYKQVSNTIPVVGLVGFHVFYVAVPVNCCAMAFMIVYAWWMTMKSGAALANPEVQRVISAAKSLQTAHAAGDDWNQRVTCPALELHALMGILTRTWGYELGCFTISCWTFAIGIVAIWLDGYTLPGVDRIMGLPQGFWHTIMGALVVQ